MRKIIANFKINQLDRIADQLLQDARLGYIFLHHYKLHLRPRYEKDALAGASMVSLVNTLFADLRAKSDEVKASLEDLWRHDPEAQARALEYTRRQIDPVGQIAGHFAIPYTELVLLRDDPVIYHPATQTYYRIRRRRGGDGVDEVFVFHHKTLRETRWIDDLMHIEERNKHFVMDGWQYDQD